MLAFILIQHVIAISAGKIVNFSATVEDIVASIAVEIIPASIADQHVIKCATDQILDPIVNVPICIPTATSARGKISRYPRR